MGLNAPTCAWIRLLGAAALAGAMLAGAVTPAMAGAAAQTFHLDSKITQALAERVLSIDPHSNLTIELNSPGGSLRAALKIARFIRRNGLSTHVRADGRCSSACLLVLQAGVRRTAGEGAQLIIHAASNAVGHPSIAATRRYVSAMVEFGASPRLAFEILPIVDRVVPPWRALELGIVQGVLRGTRLVESAAPAMRSVIVVADDDELAMTTAAGPRRP